MDLTSRVICWILSGDDPLSSMVSSSASFSFCVTRQTYAEDGQQSYEDEKNAAI